MCTTTRVFFPFEWDLSATNDNSHDDNNTMTDGSVVQTALHSVVWPKNRHWSLCDLYFLYVLRLFQMQMLNTDVAYSVHSLQYSTHLVR